MDLISTLKTLAHPGRFRIVQSLAGRELSVGDLQTLLNKRQAYISQQLARLRMARLIHCRKEGSYRYYSADPTVTDLLRIIQVIVDPHALSPLELGFRARGHSIEPDLVGKLHRVVKDRPCTIRDLVLFAPTSQVCQPDQGPSLVTFVLSPTPPSNEMEVCPGLIRDVLQHSGYDLLAEGRPGVTQGRNSETV